MLQKKRNTIFNKQDLRKRTCLSCPICPLTIVVWYDNDIIGYNLWLLTDISVLTSNRASCRVVFLKYEPCEFYCPTYFFISNPKYLIHLVLKHSSRNSFCSTLPPTCHRTKCLAAYLKSTFSSFNFKGILHDLITTFKWLSSQVLLALEEQCEKIPSPDTPRINFPRGRFPNNSWCGVIFQFREYTQVLQNHRFLQYSKHVMLRLDRTYLRITIWLLQHKMLLPYLHSAFSLASQSLRKTKSMAPTSLVVRRTFIGMWYVCFSDSFSNSFLRLECKYFLKSRIHMPLRFASRPKTRLCAFPESEQNSWVRENFS